LKKRSACDANVACLRRAYDGRINQLQAVMTRVMEKGRFENKRDCLFFKKVVWQ
jgi:uncharacterized protein